MKEKTCEQRIDGHLASTLETLGTLWHGYCDPENVGADFFDDYGNPETALWEYGLSMDYVIPDDDNESPYWCWQLSWGGPSDEIRFYGTLLSEYDARLHAAEYVFKDWFDGARRPIIGDNLEVLRAIFDCLGESGTLATLQETALEDYR